VLVERSKRLAEIERKVLDRIGRGEAVTINRVMREYDVPYSYAVTIMKRVEQMIERMGASRKDSGQGGLSGQEGKSEKVEGPVAGNEPGKPEEGTREEGAGEQKSPEETQRAIQEMILESLAEGEKHFSQRLEVWRFAGRLSEMLGRGECSRYPERLSRKLIR
jgi:hypothetical protein